MNSNLNSILLDGVVLASPRLKDGRATFRIKTRRYNMVGGVYEEETSTFSIEALYESQSQMCKKMMHRGDTARVMGRLKQLKTGNSRQVIILAEHIEIKPLKVKE